MYCALLTVIIALIWLLLETNFMRVRLPYGRSKSKGRLRLLLNTAKVAPILLLSPLSINDKWHYEIEQQQAEYAKRQAEIKRHYCPICKKNFDVYVKTQTFTIGNSTFTVTGCPTCVMEYREDIYKIQTVKHKPGQSVKASFNGQITLMDLDSFGKPTRDDKHCYGLVTKEWFDRHIHDEYPEQTIDITVDNGKEIHVNGNYKKGLIGEFIDQYKAPKVKRVKATA